MRTRTKPAAVKQQLIQEWYREKDEEKYAVGKPSSEDIWEERTERLEKAFDADLSKISVLPLEDTRTWRRQHEAEVAAARAKTNADKKLA